MTSKLEEAAKPSGDQPFYPQMNPPPPQYSAPEVFNKPQVQLVQPGAIIQQQPDNCIEPAGGPYFGALQEYFLNASYFSLKQQVELGKVVLGLEFQNTYSLRDQNNARVMYAKEQSNFFTRQCCGNMRNFEVTISDFKNNEVVTFKRPLSCSWFCGKFCKDKMFVHSKDDRLLGSIEQKFSVFKPNLLLKDAAGKTVFKLKGPCWPCRTCSWVCGCNHVDFKLLTNNGVEVGRIVKKWSGILKEAFTDADNFTITFPRDLSLEMKAVCMGALILIDFEYFEEDNFWTRLLSTLTITPKI